MSALGLVTNVPRQEDIGIDLYCTIANQESKLLTFGFPFLLQLKSPTEEALTYGGKNEKGKWKQHEVEWLFQLELPLIVGIVDKSVHCVDLYSTSAVNFVRVENRDCSELMLVPRRDGENTKHVGRPEEASIPAWSDGDGGNGKRYTVDLGHPIASVRVETVEECDTQRAVKRALREVVWHEQLNCTFRRLGVPYFYWIRAVDQDPKLEWAYSCSGSEDESVVGRQLREISPALCALALGYQQLKKDDELAKLMEVLRILPSDSINSEIRNQLGLT